MRALILALLAVTLAGCTTPEPDTHGDGPTPAPPAVLYEDVQTFTLESGRDIEWKYRLEEGSNLSYTWSAGRPVRFDLHGDHDDGTDAFASHKKGTLATDQGTLVAPFTGRHGWYFHNANAQTVTIRLHVEGQFEVVGRTGGNAP